MTIMYNGQLKQFKYSNLKTKISNRTIGIDETTINNHYITDTYLRRIIIRKTITNNLQHSFHHTHCSLLFDLGAEMHIVKDRLRHSDIQTTMNIYAHVTKSE